MKKSSFWYNIVVSLIGFAGTLISVFTIAWISATLRTILSVVLIVLFSACVWMQAKTYLTESKNIIIHKTKDEVNRYLLEWLRSGGRTVIFTRDLTWADESRKIKDELKEKAGRGELTICLYKSTNTTNELKKLGAEIYEHHLPDNSLKSRFTIVDYGQTNPRITVGTRLSDGKTQNEQYSLNSNPNAYHAFIELFELVKSLNSPL